MIWLLSGSLTRLIVPHLSNLGPQSDMDFSSTGDFVVRDSLTTGTSSVAKVMIVKKIYYICSTIKYQIKAMEPLYNIAILNQ